MTPLPIALQDVAELGETGTREALRLLDLPELWVIVLVLLPALGAVAWIGYARETISMKMRVLLTTLRFLALLTLLLVLFRPVLVQRREEIKEADVIVLVDDSASMRRKDAYAGDEEVRRALEKLTGAPPAQVARTGLVRGALETALLPRIREKGYGLRMYRFSDELNPLVVGEAGNGLETVNGRGHATFLGNALNQALSANRGRHVTDVIVLSDGRSNGGVPPLDAARSAAAAGVPVHTLVVGDTRPERNVIVELVEAPSSALEGDEVAVTVRVSARGLSEGGDAQVVLEEITEEGRRESTRTVAEQTVSLDDGGIRVVLVAPEEALASGQNERRFRVKVPPVAGETLLDDNELEVAVHITPEKIRVLYVDGYPRWEYRFLKNLLLRADANLEVQCFLLSATPDFLQESTDGLPALRRVPTGRRELLESYDVIILGDVNPFAISPDPARCTEFLNSLREFVERGGGLIAQAGEYDNPRNFIGTALEELLPVVLDSSGALAFEGDTTREFRPVLEDPLNPHQIVRLHQDEETNRRLWESEGGLRGFYWYFPVVRAKPGARVLLRHPTDDGPHGRYPLLVSGYFPAGRTLFIGVDSTWMWRYRYEERYRERFWRNAIRWVALGRLKSGDRRIRLESLRGVYDLDERITLEARVLDEDFRPSEKAQQEVWLSGPDGEREELALNLVEDRPGLFRTSFEVERPGLYRAWVELDGKKGATSEWEVVLPSRENADPSPDPQTLASMSSLTGGVTLALADVTTLYDELPGDEERREPISSQLEDAWDNWGTLLFALALLAAEWITRKRLELI